MHALASYMCKVAKQLCTDKCCWTTGSIMQGYLLQDRLKRLLYTLGKAIAVHHLGCDDNAHCLGDIFGLDNLCLQFQQ